MRKLWVALAAVGLVAAGPPARGQGGEPQLLAVKAIRFYSPASATTTIEVVCELGLGAMVSGPTQAVHYRVAVSVRDTTGLELQRSDWSREVPREVAMMRGATSVETFSFRTAPGRYQVVVQATPETGSAIERTLEISGYATRPSISDLLVADAVRLAGSDSGAVAAGEIERGGLVLRTSPVPHLSPTEASLTYYAEVYLWPGAPREGDLRVSIQGPGARSVVQTTPRQVRFSPGGGITRGSLDLAGLPAGQYTLQLRVTLGDSTLVAEAPFAMNPPRVVDSTAVAAGPAADPFADASEDGLDSLYAPLVYLLEPREQGVYERLAVDGKRKFLRDFWTRRDPLLGANGAMAQFYRGVAYVSDAFREGGAGQIPGWRTDRGRIFLKNGRWDEILQRPMASPKPYEAWKYTRGRFRWYVFLDRSGLGHYQLIGSNDRQEPGLRDWQPELSLTENYNDVARFLGLVENQQ
jgi:GWxTD domain-containing protein